MWCKNKDSRKVREIDLCLLLDLLKREGVETLRKDSFNIQQNPQNEDPDNKITADEELGALGIHILKRSIPREIHPGEFELEGEVVRVVALVKTTIS